MRLSTLFQSAATGDATGSGWRTPLAIMVAIQVVTITVAAVALSGASATVTTLVLMGWAVTLVLITALTALLHAAGRVVIEAQRLRAMHLILGSAGYLSGGVGDPGDESKDRNGSVEPLDDAERDAAGTPHRRRWDDVPTVQLPLVRRRTTAPAAGSSDPAPSLEDAPADLPPALHPDGSGSPTGPVAAVGTPDPAVTPAPEAEPDAQTPGDDARWFPNRSGSTTVAGTSLPTPVESAPAAQADESQEDGEPTESFVSRLADRRSSAARATLAALAAFPTEPPSPVRRTSVRDRAGSRTVGSLR